jgi:S-adenosylmethionine hydrolase
MRSQRNVASRPIVTLTSDFGLSDAYVAQMKARILRECPDVRLIDVTHNVPPQDVLCGSISLERAVDGFPPGTIHLAVVDPGVGTDRRLLLVKINGQIVVCPDNGLITWTWRSHPPGNAHEITWRPTKFSATFHGRDVLAPVCGRIACGEPIARFARPIHDPMLLDLAPANNDAKRGQIIHVDHFGNATTNIAVDDVRGRNSPRAIRVKGRAVGKIRKTYWDVAPGKPLALIGSSGLLEIAVRDGSAARELKLKVGDEVVIS